jgi:beta-glucosidase
VPDWKPLLPTAPISFPPDFLWGVASSAFQAEGGDVANDWVDLARRGEVPPNPGNGFWDRYAEDFRLVAALGVRHYRLSVEWSRVEPERGRFDESAIDRYRAICDAATAAGLVPWVNFFHFTHPRWLVERGGLLEPANHADFLRYVERVGRALAPHARHFHVQNESLVHVFGAYLVGEMPPGLRDGEAAVRMTRTVLALHAGAHAILKGIDPGCTVATIEVWLDYHPEDPGDPANVRTVEAIDRWYNGAWLGGLATGRLELPGREPVEIPGLRGAADLYGLNYYSALRLGPSGVGSWTDLPDAPVDAMGRFVHPRGLTEALLRVAKALPGLPILVTENGCPTTDEGFRIRYLAAHLAALDRARRAGADVRGYFHWTAVDNYEWRHGFSDARFGLFGFDPATFERRPKRSAAWLADVIARGSLDPASLA